MRQHLDDAGHNAVAEGRGGAAIARLVNMESAAELDNFRRPFRLQLANLERSLLAGVDLRDADLTCHMQ